MRHLIHSLSDPFVIRSIRYLIHLLSDPFVIQSIHYPIHLLSDPFVIRSIRYPIHLLSNPFVIRSRLKDSNFTVREISSFPGVEMLKSLCRENTIENNL